MTRTEKTPTVSPSTRLRVAQVLAFVALLAALVGALGPAERVRTNYSWPPPTLPTGTPERGWYTPLLLIRHRPEAISASVPCTLPPALPGAAKPLTVLASARFPERAGGLALVRSGERLSISVGERVLDRVLLTDAGDEGCAYRLSLVEGRWSLEGGTRALARGGALEQMPVVTGLFSALDLRSGTPPVIEVRTAVHATRTITRQAVAWTIAALAIVAAFLLVALERRPRPGAALRRAALAARRNAHPADGFVAFVLLAWWVLSPAFFDDGWILAKQSMFSASRGFSTYYVSLGTNAPLGYWLDWLQHWLTQSTNALLFLRLPALSCLAATWVLSRWILARVLASSVGTSHVALWGLACAFLVGALAWGMTLRPEPVVALLVTAVLACVVRFLERETAAPLVVAAVLVPLALMAHPAGIVSLAPVLVLSPKLIRWARTRMQVATTVVPASIALLVVLVFIGSDIEQRRTDSQLLRTYGSFGDWRNELLRYALLDFPPYGTPLRRLTVALIALTIVAFVLRQRRGRRALLDFPTLALAVGMALLITTPSKWPWHFGALLGLAAVGVGSETARLQDERNRSRGWRAWPFLAVGAAALVAAWAWWTRAPWNLVDLRTFDWNPGYDSRFSLTDLAILLPVLLLAGAIPITLARRRSNRLHDVPWRVASWTAPVLAVPMIGFTMAILVADIAKTSSWTLGRQNLEAIAGTRSCGLADDLLAPVLTSARSLPAAQAGDGTQPPGWVPPAPVASVPRFFLRATARGSVNAPWFELHPARRFGLFVAGILGPADTLELEWGRRRGGQVEPLGGDKISSVISELPRSAPWQFFSAGELPTPPARATTVRVTFRTDIPVGAAIAVTAPVTYSTEPLARRTANAASRTLVHPDLLTYFPCTHLPRLGEGLVEVPRYLVAAGHPSLPRDYRSTPFFGLDDLYELARLPIADSPNPPERVFAFEVDETIPGAKRAAPVASTIVS